MNGCTRAVVLVLDFAIPGGIIGVLRLFVLLVRVSVGNATENLELREEEKVISRRCDVIRHICRAPPFGNGYSIIGDQINGIPIKS